MDYHSAIKSNEVLIPFITWMNLENIMLNKRRKTQRATFYVIPCITSKIGKPIETEDRLVVAKGWEEEE